MVSNFPYQSFKDFDLISRVGFRHLLLIPLVFMIIAASCFAKSSPRFLQWVLDLPGVGPSVAAYRRGEGMPLRAKVLALSMLTVAVVLSAFIAIDTLWIRLVVIAVGVYGFWFIAFRTPTAAD